MQVSSDRGVNPDLEPELQDQKRPQPHMMVAGAGAVLVEKAANIASAEKAALCSPARQQDVIGKFPKLVAEPLVDGTPEPHLGPMEQFNGEVRRHRGFE